MYVKEDELDENFSFAAGIKLLKDLPKRLNFKISPFRCDTGYSEVFDSVFTKFILHSTRSTQMRKLPRLRMIGKIELSF